MLPGEIRRYKQSSFPLLSLLDDSGQPGKRNPKSRFQRPPENGGLRETRLPHIVDKQTRLPHIADKQTRFPHIVDKQTRLPHIVDKQTRLPHIVDKQTRLPQIVDKQTRLPHIVDKQSQVASSQEERNIGLSLTAHDSAFQREHAPGRHHPNKGKRSRGIFDSDLEQRVAPINGQNSKPLSKQKLRKRRKRAGNGNDLLDDVELIILDKMLGNDSSENRPSTERRRNKSHVRENSDSSKADKTNKARRIQSCDRAPCKAPKTKSLAKVKDALRNPKPHSKTPSDDASLKEGQKQSMHDSAAKKDNCSNPKTDESWKDIVARYRPSSASVSVDDLPSDFWEEECRLANELAMSLYKTESKKKIDKIHNDVRNTERMEAEERRSKKASTNNSEIYIKFQNTRRFVPDLNKGEKKKLRQFTQLIKDKVRRKADILSEHISDDKECISDNKCKHTSLKDNTTHGLESSPSHTNASKLNRANPLNIQPSKRNAKRSKDGAKDDNLVKYSVGRMKSPKTVNNFREKKENTNENFETVSEKDTTIKKTKGLKQKSENEKDIRKSCSKSKKLREEKKNELDGVSGNTEQIQRVKSKQKEKMTANGSAEYSANNLCAVTKSKGKMISKTQSNTPGKRSSAKRHATVVRGTVKPKYNQSVHIEPHCVETACLKSKEHFSDKPVISVSERLDAKQHATPELKPAPASPDTSLSKRSSLPKPAGTSCTSSLRKAHSEKANTSVSERKDSKTSKSSMPGRLTKVKPDTCVSQRSVSAKHSTLNCGKVPEAKHVNAGLQTTVLAHPVKDRNPSSRFARERDVSRKHATGVPGKKAALKTAITASSGRESLRKTDIPTSERNAAAKPVTYVPERSSKIKHDMQVSRRPPSRKPSTNATGRQAATMHTAELSRRKASHKPVIRKPEQGRPSSANYGISEKRKSQSSKTTTPLSGRRQTSAKTDTTESGRSATAKLVSPLLGKPKNGTPMSGKKAPAKPVGPASGKNVSAMTPPVSGRPFTAKTEIRQAHTTERSASAKTDTRVLQRSAFTKPDPSVSEMPDSAKANTQMSGRRASANTDTSVYGRPGSTKTDMLVRAGSKDTSVSRRATSARSDKPLSARAASAKPDTPVSVRAGSAINDTPVSRRAASARTNPPVSARPGSAKTDTPITGKQASTRTVAPDSRKSALIIDTPVSERPASENDTTMSRRPALAKFNPPVSVRSGSVKSDTTLSGRPASTNADPGMSRKLSMPKPDLPVSRRPGSAKNGTIVSESPASARTLAPKLGRPASAKTDPPVSGRPGSANNATPVSGRPASAKTNTLVLGRPASAKADTSISPRSVSAKNVTTVPGRPVSAKTNTPVLGRPASAKADTSISPRSVSAKNTPLYGRPVSAQTDTPVSGRPVLPKTDTSLTDRPSSTKGNTCVSERPTLAKISTPVFERPASANIDRRSPPIKIERKPTSANIVSGRSLSVKTDTTLPGTSVGNTATPLSNRQVSPETDTPFSGRPSSARTQRRPASVKTNSVVSGSSASIKTDTVLPGRPFSAKTDNHQSRRPSSTETERRPTSAKADTFVPGKPTVVNTDTTTLGRPVSAKTDRLQAVEKLGRRPVSAKTDTPLSRRPVSTKTAITSTERLASVNTVSPSSDRSAPVKTDMIASKRPFSAKLDTTLSERPASAKPTTQMTKRPTTAVPRRPSSTRILTPASAVEPSRKLEGLSLREQQLSAGTKSRTRAMTSASHVTITSRASSPSTNISSGSQNDMYDDDFEYESAPSRCSLSESYDNLGIY